jgi:hypothetical protein
LWPIGLHSTIVDEGNLRHTEGEFMAKKSKSGKKAAPKSWENTMGPKTYKGAAGGGSMQRIPARRKK